MADDLLLMRRKQKSQWRQREEDRRIIRQQLDASSSSGNEHDQFTKEETKRDSSEIPSTDSGAVHETSKYQVELVNNVPLALDLPQTESSVVSQELVFDVHARAEIKTKIQCNSELRSSHFKQERILSLTKNLSGNNNEKKCTSQIRQPMVENRVLPAPLNSSDSSDDDENHLDFFRKRHEQIENKKEITMRKTVQHDESIVADTRIESTSTCNPETSAVAQLEKSTHLQLLMNVDDSSSSDEDLLQGFKEHLKSQVLSNSKENVADNENNNCREPEVLPSKLGSIEMQTSRANHQQISKNQTPEKRSPARNPLARMKEMDLSFKEYLDDRNRVDHKSEETKLWSDSENSLEKSDETKRKRISSDKESSNRSSKKQTRSKETDTNIDDTEWVSKDCNRNSIFANFDHDEIIESEAKPSFSNPKFGPFKNIPLLLNVQNNDVVANSLPLETYEVPASINRYLKEYQQEGIRFVFEKAITSQYGAILGDDMGLGKTVQIVSLLAALLEKSGTGKDATILKERNRLAKEKIFHQNANREEALMQGRILIETTSQTSASSVYDFPLPKWCPILIVIPKSVADGWLKTFAEWGYFSVAMYDGPKRLEAVKAVIDGICEIMICSMAMLSRKDDFELIQSCNWKVVVVDEFHQFKNERGLLSKNLRELKQLRNCVVIGLTGTVMQNDHKELWNLVDLAAKDFFGSWADFEAKYVKPIKHSRAKDANIHAIELGRIKGQELSSKLKEIYIQRKKEDVLADELPDKDERIVFCEPSQLQKDLYEYILKLPDFVLLRESSGPCDCGVNQKFFLELQCLPTNDRRIAYLRKNRQKLLTRGKCCYKLPRIDGNRGDVDPNAIIWRQMHKDNRVCESCPTCICLPALDILNKLSSHASLLQPETHPDNLPDGPAKAKAVDLLERAKVLIPKHLIQRFPGQSYIRQNRITDDHFSLSGKMKVVDRLLKRIKTLGGRLLFFSQSTRVLDIVQNYVIADGYSFLRMDGSTSSKKRDECVELFQKNDDIFIFLLSTRAMGIGLNLTAANFVIIFDVEWNPSNDAQAQDRVYRIGQQRNVTVFRLVCRGTVEEQKYMRQTYKKQLKSETIMDDVEADRITSSRLFKGVAGDKYRKGELFGFVNLLKFSSQATFINYGQQDAGSSRYGDGVHTNANVEEAINGRHESQDEDDVADLLEGLARTHKDIATRTTKDADEESRDTFNDLGGESQVMMDIFDRARTVLPIDSSLPNAAESAVSRPADNRKTRKEAEKTKASKERVTQEIIGSPRLEMGQRVAPKRTEDGKRVLKAKQATTLSKIDEIVERTTHTYPPTNTSRPVSSRNVTLVGQTTKGIKSGAAKTSFSLTDLHLPSGAKRQKP